MEDEEDTTFADQEESLCFTRVMSCAIVAFDIMRLARKAYADSAGTNIVELDIGEVIEKLKPLPSNRQLEAIMIFTVRCFDQELAVECQVLALAHHLHHIMAASPEQLEELIGGAVPSLKGLETMH